MNIDDVRRAIENFRCPVCDKPTDIHDVLVNNARVACEPCWDALEETKTILNAMEDSL